MNVNIRDERTSRGWSQKYVANIVDVTPETIHMIETGKRQPSNKVYYKLMSLFGYEVPRIVSGNASGEASHLSKEDNTTGK